MKVLTNNITSTIGLAVLLVIMFGSTFTTAAILYIQQCYFVGDTTTI